MQRNLLITIFLFLGAGAVLAQCPGPSQRTALLNLQRSVDYLLEGKAGQVPLTDTCGNQRYAQYVEINPDTINYIPTSTGNTSNLSEFVVDTLGSLWYIDWQGNSVEFGGSACDADWLQISDNSCPDALTDSIYKYKYASIGARLVWPGGELLVNDSSSAALQVIQGSRNARLAVRDFVNETWTMLDHGGSTPYFYFPVDADFVFSTASGTPQSPSAETSHFSINASDSTIQMHEYPDTRRDTNTINNFLYTDNTGKIRSQSIDSIQSGGNGIYGGSGSVADGTIASIDPAATFTVDVLLGSQFKVGDYANAINGVGVLVDENQVGMGDIFGSGDYYGYFGSAGNYMRSPASNFQQLASNSTWDILSGSTYRFTDSRATKTGVEYSSSAYGADFTDATLVHRAYVADMISDSLASAGSGTVTSVGLSLPSIFSVSGSPVTTSGTLTGSLATQTANTVFAGPTSGGAAAPTFRALVNADIPSGAGGFLLDGGNTTGATVTAGTNDAQSLVLETNNTAFFTANSSGNVGLGSTPGGMRLAVTLTDVSTSGTPICLQSRLTNSPGSNSSGSMRSLNMANYFDASGINFTGNPAAAWFENRVINAGNFTGHLYGIYTSGLLMGGDAVAIGTVTNASAISLIPVTSFSNSISGTVTNARGAYVQNASKGSLTITNQAGINVAPLTAGTNNTAILLGTITLPSGNFGIYSTITDASYFNGKIGIGDTSPEVEIDVTGTAAAQHLIGQNLTPTIAVNTAGAGTGASASMTNAQSSDIAGRFSVTSGAGATTGLWATVTFDDAFTVTPVVQVYSEDADASNLKHYVNVNTTSFELFINGGQSDGTAYDFNFIIIGGK